jgi:hypothetical protein
MRALCVRPSVCVSVRSSPFVVLRAAPADLPASSTDLVAMHAGARAGCWIHSRYCVEGVGSVSWVALLHLVCSACLFCCLPCLILSVGLSLAVWVLAVASEVTFVVIDVCRAVTVSSTVAFLVLPR